MVYLQRFTNPEYKLYKRYIISNGNIKDLLRNEYEKFLQLYKPRLEKKEELFYKNILSFRKQEFENALNNGKIDILITRFGYVHFKIGHIQNNEYSLEARLNSKKWNIILKYKKEDFQKVIKQMLIELKRYNFSIKLEEKISKHC